MRENLPTKVMMAILVSKITIDLLDMRFQLRCHDKSLSHQEARDKVFGTARHRAQMVMSAPMEIGEVAGVSEWDWQREDDWNCGRYGESFDIEAIGKGGDNDCHRCRGGRRDGRLGKGSGTK